MSKKFAIDKIEIGGSRPFLVAGPCVIENEKITLEIASSLKKIASSAGFPLIFKASFDKANRSSLSSFRGPGLEKGMAVLARVKEELDLPVLSDIHEPWQAARVADVLSVIQVPAFLCRQTDLLLAAGETGLPVNIKKGQFMAPEDMGHVLEKVRSTGNHRLMLTERGTFFGYRNLVVDFRNIPIMKGFGVPVIMDATHSVQRPSAAGGVSGGAPEFIPHMAACGMVCGASGIFLEVHPNPGQALSDGSNSLEIKKLESLLFQLKKLYNAVG